MTTAKDQMKMLQSELDRIRGEIEKLRIEEALLVKMLARLSGAPIEKSARTRSPSVKPVVLDFMRHVGEAGATTAEVDAAVRLDVPSVAKDTVGSVLSRLKSEGALEYVGERYYEKQFAPKAGQFDRTLRAVN